ncbi:MAG: PQ-loop domain-containing transporter [Muribaculaceae bacterium]|nr:PQ-loop domain-containing transporter [Muribaculaceae bacterium]
MDSLWINIVGYAAAICMVCGYLPQAIYTIRTRDTDGIALPTFLLMGLGGFFFIIQGAMLRNWPLMITNIITTICAAIVFGMKIYNDHWKKK